MPKTSCSLSTRRLQGPSSSTETPPADVNGCSLEQLARLPAEILRLHLASRHLVTSRLKATMVKHFYDALNPSTFNNDDDVSSPSMLTRTNTHPPLLNQQTATNTNVLPPALQEQLWSLMAQLLQYVRHAASQHQRRSDTKHQ